MDDCGKAREEINSALESYAFEIKNQCHMDFKDFIDREIDNCPVGSAAHHVLLVVSCALWNWKPEGYDKKSLFVDYADEDDRRTLRSQEFILQSTPFQDFASDDEAKAAYAQLIECPSHAALAEEGEINSRLILPWEDNDWDMAFTVALVRDALRSDEDGPS